MSEISNFWLPYLVPKSTHPVSLVLSSQNVQCFYISAHYKERFDVKGNKSICVVDY